MTDTRAWLANTLQARNFRAEVIAAILSHADVEIRDWDSVSGGGTVLAAGPSRWRIVLATVQHEAACHEAAHVWWFLSQNDALVARLIAAMLHQADLVHRPRFRMIRELCRLYCDGCTKKSVAYTKTVMLIDHYHI